MLRTMTFRGLFIAATAVSSIASAQTVGTTQKLCVFAGLGDTRAPSQPNVALYGTDLGFTYSRNNKLEILFGDTWANSLAWAPNIFVPRDDTYGSIDLIAFPDGDSVETRCNSTGTAPPIIFGTALTTTLATLNPGVAMDGLKTPVAAFTAGKQSTSREFGIFSNVKPVACSTNAECSGFTCDLGLGYSGTAPSNTGAGLTLPCVDGTSGCTAQTKSGMASGFCRDTGSSTATPNDTWGRLFSVTMRHKVGLRSTASPRSNYSTRDWITSRFINPFTATVNNFDPTRANGVGNDYTTADGISPATEKVFVWGRPWWTSVNATGHNLHMYLAYVDMPTVSSTGAFAWAPKYFTGLDTLGRPTFSTNQLAAVPLNLSGTPTATNEAYDVVQQMSIRWVPAFNKWVMFYGGGTQTSGDICNIPGQNCDLVELQGAAIRMRTATNPWGPWSAPQNVLVGGEPDDGPQPDNEYRSGGVLRHPDCVGSDCAPHSAPLDAANETGLLYAANIIEEWTEVRAGGAVDFYWLVSSWDPYRVTLMKTRVNP
jgi:hypothetical protein